MSNMDKVWRMWIRIASFLVAILEMDELDMLQLLSVRVSKMSGPVVLHLADSLKVAEGLKRLQSAELPQPPKWDLESFASSSLPTMQRMYMNGIYDAELVSTAIEINITTHLKAFSRLEKLTACHLRPEQHLWGIS